MPKMATHIATRIQVKNGNALVDVGIQPIVNWLNAFDTVETAHSCQGDELHSEFMDLPYVAFYCEDGEDLKEILKTIMQKQGICSSIMWAKEKRRPS